MKYLKLFSNDAEYQAFIGGGGVHHPECMCK